MCKHCGKAIAPFSIAAPALPLPYDPQPISPAQPWPYPQPTIIPQPPPILPDMVYRSQVESSDEWMPLVLWS